MKRAIQVLSALLAAQLLLALAVNRTGPDLSTQGAAAPMIAADTDKLDRITIESADKSKLTLAKTGGAWQLEDKFSFPADAGRVTQLISRLKAIKLGAPVATSKAAIERFKVADDSFERRIGLGSGGSALATLYFGTRQGMRDVNARRADQSEVFAVEFSVFDAPVRPEDWQDKTVLQVPRAEIESIHAGGLQLKQVAGAKDDKKETKPTWQADQAGPGESLMPEAADKLAGLLSGLQFDGVLGRDPSTDFGLDKPLLQLALVRKGGKRVDYQLGKMADGRGYALKTSMRDEYFRLSTQNAESLIDAAKRESLVELQAKGKAKLKK